MTTEEKDLLDYYSMNSEMYQDGFRHGVETAFEKLKFYIDIYKDREQSYQPSRTIPEFNKGTGAIHAFDEVLAVVEEIKEDLL